MSIDVLVLGSGTMARDIGAWLIGRGRSVCWVSGSEERRGLLLALGQKALRRLGRADAGMAAEVRVATAAPGTLRATARLVIETTTEQRDCKQQAIAGVQECIGADTVLVSNSSSILPGAIDTRCVGMHFFAPVTLSGIVEIVLEQGRDTTLLERARREAEALGLEYVVEDEHSAFAANRMLLGLQNEAALALAAGVPEETIDECSHAAGIGIGAVELIRRVGAGTVGAAVDAYRTRMDSRRAAELEPLVDMLAGRPPDVQPKRAREVPGPEEIRRRMACALVVGALRFETEGLLGRASIDALWLSALDAGESLSTLLDKEDIGTLGATAHSLYEQTGLSYFEPLGPLAR